MDNGAKVVKSTTNQTISVLLSSVANIIIPKPKIYLTHPLAKYPGTSSVAKKENQSQISQINLITQSSN